MSEPAVSIVVTAHREGELLRRTFASAQTAALMAGAPSELLVICDRADEDTSREARALDGARVIVIDRGDPASARAAGVAASRAPWIAFLDGDDLWGPSWLRLALARAQAEEPSSKLALHSELTATFGARAELWRHVSAHDADFRAESLLEQNPWTSLAFVSRALAASVPPTETRAENGFGFEDWHWNCETLAAGAKHEAVPGTIHFVRAREGSRGAGHRGRAALPPPTALASDELLLSCAEEPLRGSESRRKPWLALETSARGARDRARTAGTRTAWRAIAGAIHHVAAAPQAFDRIEALPEWARREREAIRRFESRLVGDRFHRRSLHQIRDPEGLSAFARWTLAWRGQDSLAIGSTDFVDRDRAGVRLAIENPLGRALWQEADGLVIDDDRLRWIARAIVQARPAELRLERTAFSRALVDRYGAAIASAGTAL